MSDVFHALSNPVRREIIALLRQSDLSAGEIAEQLSVVRSTLSGHFNVLKNAGLIISERRGTTIIYSLNASVLEDLITDLLGLLRVQGGADPAQDTSQGESK